VDFSDKDADSLGAICSGNGICDELGDFSPAVQVKLLRVIQEREYERVGSSKTVEADLRIVTVTNRELENCIEYAVLLCTDGVINAAARDLGITGRMVCYKIENLDIDHERFSEKKKSRITKS